MEQQNCQEETTNFEYPLHWIRFFFPWGPIFEFGNNYRTVFFSWWIIFEQGKKCPALVLFPDVLFFE